VNLTVELDREEDGRWIAEALELPGVMCYGQTRDAAVCNVGRLAIEVIGHPIAHGELPSFALCVSFAIPDEQLARQLSEAGSHDQDEIGPRMLVRVAKRTGLRPEDL
jgi:predicted RNase H-like HicB family nuclease